MSKHAHELMSYLQAKATYASAFHSDTPVVALSAIERVLSGDLVALMQDCLNCIEKSAEFRGGHPAYEWNASRLRAAIVKATGEQQ